MKEMSDSRIINLEDPRMVREVVERCKLYQVRPQDGKRILVVPVDAKPMEPPVPNSCAAMWSDGHISPRIELKTQEVVHFFNKVDAVEFASECMERRSKGHKEKLEISKLKKQRKLHSSVGDPSIGLDRTGYFQFRFSGDHRRYIIEVTRHVELLGDLLPTEDELRKQIVKTKCIALAHTALVDRYWPKCRWHKCGAWQI